MFQLFIYLSKRLFNFWVNTYFMSQFFVATSILDVSQLVKMLWFMSLYYEILIVVLSLFFSLLLLQPFNFSPVSFACNFQDWGCVILRESDFLLKICWSIPCLHPLWKVHTWIEICASLNHRKKTKADGSRLIPRKHTETLVLLSVLMIAVAFAWLSHRQRTRKQLKWFGRCPCQCLSSWSSTTDRFVPRKMIVNEPWCSFRGCKTKIARDRYELRGADWRGVWKIWICRGVILRCQKHWCSATFQQKSDVDSEQKNRKAASTSSKNERQTKELRSTRKRTWHAKANFRTAFLT